MSISLMRFVWFHFWITLRWQSQWNEWHRSWITFFVSGWLKYVPLSFDHESNGLIIGTAIEYHMMIMLLFLAHFQRISSKNELVKKSLHIQTQKRKGLICSLWRVLYICTRWITWIEPTSFVRNDTFPHKRKKKGIEMFCVLFYCEFSNIRCISKYLVHFHDWVEIFQMLEITSLTSPFSIGTWSKVSMKIKCKRLTG